MNIVNQHNNVSVFLLGVSLNLLAAIDFTSLVDYGLKAFLGGVIWLGFKLLGDYIAQRLRKRKPTFQILRRKAG